MYMYLLFLVLIIQPLPGLATLTCLQCDGVSHPRHCRYVAQCFDGEVCGVERVLNTLGQTVYNVGCVHTSKCTSNTTSETLSSSDGCHECCRSNLCNAGGCGETGYPLMRGPICYNCQIQVDINACNTIEFCEQGEVCSYSVRKEFGDIVYSSKCSNRHTCASTDGGGGIAIVGRDVHVPDNSNDETRQAVDRRTIKDAVCEGCCDKDLCNRGCNGTDIAPTSPCDSQPCAHGKCFDRSDEYICVCDHGYIGKQCATFDYCHPNPCARGTCINGAVSYTCDCPAGFSGGRCEAVPATDCYDIRHMNIGNTTGVYTISLWKSHENILVLCDMDTNGGGWTVFQNRFNGSVDFYRNFASYTNGFGSVYGEYWLGLKYIHEIVSRGLSELRIDLTRANGNKGYETFKNFSISAGPNFTLHILRGTGTLGDRNSGLTFDNNMHFSTMDRDMDTYIGNCANEFHGGWWFQACMGSDLNGHYFTPGTVNVSSMSYYEFTNDYESLKTSKMMLRRV